MISYRAITNYLAITNYQAIKKLSGHKTLSSHDKLSSRKKLYSHKRYLAIIIFLVIKAKEDNVIGDTTLTVCYSHCAKNIILKHLKGPTRTTFHVHITLILHTGRWGTKHQLVLHSGGQTDWLYTSMFTFSLFLRCYL